MKAKDFRYNGHRNSYTALNEVYFWTITIYKWQHLLKPDSNKMININSLQWLVQSELVNIWLRNKSPHFPVNFQWQIIESLLTFKRRRNKGLQSRISDKVVQIINLISIL